MNTVLARSVKVGLVATALVCVGTGVASAHGAAPGSAPASTAGPVVVHPDYRIKRGPVGTVVDDAARQLQALDASHRMHPMQPAGPSQPARAASEHRYVPTRHHSTAPAQPVDAKAVITGLKTARRPAAAPPPSSSRRSAGCKCGAQITLGPPTINAQAADVAPGAEVRTGDPAAIRLPVTNLGPSAVSTLAASSPAGGLTCEDTSLAADQTTTCTTSTPAQDGAHILPLTVTAKGPEREPLMAARSAFYAASLSAPAGHGTLDPGTPTVNGDPAGTAPGPQVRVGDPAAVSVPVTNRGDAAVSGLAATSPAGTLSCAGTSLAPSQTTNCTLSVTADPGAQTLRVTLSGTDPNGVLSASTAVHYTGGAPGSGPGGDGSTGRPIGGTGPGSGSGSGSGSSGASGATGSTSQVTVVPSGAPNTGGGAAPDHGPRPWLPAGLSLMALAGLLQVARRQWGSRP